MKDFLTIRDLEPTELREVLDSAAEIKAYPDRYADALRGKTLALIFDKPSLRTFVTFEVGIQQFGGFAITLPQSGKRLGERESVHDVAKNLERMVQGVMIRTFAHETLEQFARHSAVPVINGLTDYCHPCQALADYLTIREHKNRLRGINLCYVGDGNNVAHSLMLCGARLGVNVTVACPEGYKPLESVIRHASEDAKGTGAKIRVVHNAAEGATEADVIYTDVWASMGQESEAQERDAIFRPYQVNRKLMECAWPDAIFLHCLPAHRGDEVTDEVIDGPASVVFQQAENRLHAQKAIMLRLMK